MKAKYIIVGDNNFWYSITGEITKKELDNEIAEIKRAITAGEYENTEKVCELFVYQTDGKAKSIELY